MHSTWRSRGWTCQERILSPRIIYYSSTQRFWQCLHCIRSEDNFGPFGIVSDHLFDMRSNWREMFFGIDQRRPQQRSSDGEQLRIDNDKDEQIDLHDFGSAWTRGVMDGEYSDRSLGRGSDKLVAISSLARRIHCFHPSPYYTGLWGSSLLESLS